jgi:hypothetical protein
MEAIPESQLRSEMPDSSARQAETAPGGSRALRAGFSAPEAASAVLALAAGLWLRLWMLGNFFQVNGDSLIYGGLAKSLLLHGRYALAGAGAEIYPTLIRLPGYPLFLALVWRILGMENYVAAAWVQIGLELAGCVLLADFARRIAADPWKRGTALATLWLAALCPFTAIYAAQPLTEAPTLFALAVALNAAARFRQRPRWGSALAFTFAVTWAALLRPDGALVGLALAPALALGLLPRAKNSESPTSGCHPERPNPELREGGGSRRTRGSVLQSAAESKNPPHTSLRLFWDSALHFFRSRSMRKKNEADQAVEKLGPSGFVSGPDLSRADNANRMNWALAPANADSSDSLQRGPFSATVGPISHKKSLRMALTCLLLALAPFAVWTWRNWNVFHMFEPLAPRYATDPGEDTWPGWQRWTKTWCLDFVSTYDVYWNVPGQTLDLTKLPARAFDSPAQYAETAALAADYNAGGQLFTPSLDARFAKLAADRIRAHPMRYYVWLPLGRLADMTLRPRVENLPIDMDWWAYWRHRAETRFSWFYAGLNALYLLLAVGGLCLRPRLWPWMALYLALRGVLLMTIEGPEARYTLEYFPIFFALGGVFAGWAMTRARHAHP